MDVFGHWELFLHVYGGGNWTTNCHYAASHVCILDKEIVVFVSCGNIVCKVNYMLVLMFEFTDEPCRPEIFINWNSMAEAFSSQSLTINCPVKYCDEKPEMRWCSFADSNVCHSVKETEQNEMVWRSTNEKSGIFSLHFKSITKTDSGLYRCQVNYLSSNYLSHSINVTVTGNYSLHFIQLWHNCFVPWCPALACLCIIP